MKSSILLCMLIVCLFFSACTHEKLEPEYSQEETLIEGNSVSSVNVLAMAELQFLDDTQVIWGPGREVDDQNRPTACVKLQEEYGKYDAVFLTQEQGICLTFDEGYEAGYTAGILDTLQEEGVSAVFFVTLDYAKKEPALIQRMIDEGHTIGNHTAYHPNMTQISLEKAAENIQVLHDYVYQKFQYEMRLLRNPEGAFSEQTLALAQNMGYRSVLWSFAYNDWNTDQQPSAEDALQRLTNALHPGAVYLLHAVSKTNHDILGEWIREAKAEGYSFITMG